MPIVTCQYTGIVFEAASRRQKNHPRVSAALDRAAKSGTYGTAVERLAEAREAGMTDLDAILAYVASGEREAIDARRREADAREQARKDRDLAFRRAAAEREATNAILRTHGYQWRKEDEESLDAFGAGAFQALYGNASHVWLLIAPDGREVAVREAMEAIAATGSADAQQWLAERQP